MSNEQIWFCKVGGPTAVPLPRGADAPMRAAIQSAFAGLAGVEPAFIFSGWGGELTEGERAVHENREPARVEADNDCVICPGCCHQFPAIPVNVQKRLFASPPEGGVVPVAGAVFNAEYGVSLVKRGTEDEYVQNGDKRLYTSPPAAASEAVAWQDMALAKLGRVRDQMSPADVRCIQRFLDPAPLSGATHV